MSDHPVTELAKMGDFEFSTPDPPLATTPGVCVGCGGEKIFFSKYPTHQVQDRIKIILYGPFRFFDPGPPAPDPTGTAGGRHVDFRNLRPNFAKCAKNHENRGTSKKFGPHGSKICDRPDANLEKRKK